MATRWRQALPLKRIARPQSTRLGERQRRRRAHTWTRRWLRRRSVRGTPSTDAAGDSMTSKRRWRHAHERAPAPMACWFPSLQRSSMRVRRSSPARPRRAGSASSALLTSCRLRSTTRRVMHWQRVARRLVETCAPRRCRCHRHHMISRQHEQSRRPHRPPLIVHAPRMLQRHPRRHHHPRRPALGCIHDRPQRVVAAGVQATLRQHRLAAGCALRAHHTAA